MPGQATKKKEGETASDKPTRKKEDDSASKNKVVNLSLRAKRKPTNVLVGEVQKVQLEVSNASAQALRGCKVQLWAEGRLVGENNLNLPPKAKAMTELTFKPEADGLTKLEARLLPPEGITVSNQKRTQIQIRIKVKPPKKPSS